MSTPRSLSSRLIWGPAAAVGLILLLLYLQGTFAAKVPPGNGESMAPRAQGPTTRVEEEILPLTLRWPATVTTHTIARVAPKIPGRIMEITVDIGAKVDKGQLLARLDDHQIRARLQAARSAVAAARAQAARAAADARRITTLHAQGAATRQALDAAVAAARTSRARVEQSRHQVEALRAQLNETRIRAPFPGEVVERFADPGDMGLPGKPILALQNPSRMRIETAIPEHCARLLEPGQSLTIIDPASGKRLAAEVTDKSAAADPASHTLLVKAALPPEPALLPGAFVWAEQSCGRQKTRLVPLAAVKRVGQLEQVTQVIDGKAFVRLVRTGSVIDGRVEILSGLSPGDVVLLPNGSGKPGGDG